MSPARCAHACLKSAPSGCGLPCRSIVCSCFPESGMNSSAARPESANLAAASLLPKRNADAILAGSLKTLLLLLLLLALVLPLIAILSQALLDHGNWAGSAPWVHLIDNPNFLPLVGRSLGVAAATALLLAPSLLPGIALIYLFGNQGLFKEWMNGSIYGFWGILLGEAFYTFPHALMILLSALSLADARLYDAASAMGANSWKTFRTVTLPATRYGIFGAFCLVFTLTITDFGVPKIVGGAFSVLAVEAYKAVVGQQQFDRGALIGLLLLIPALLTFFIDGWLQKRQRAQMSSRAEVLVPRRQWRRDSVYTLILMAISGALLLMIAVAIGASLVKLWPYNLKLTLMHYDFDNMDGGGWLAYWNSLRLAIGTSIVGTAVIFTGAWLMEKTRSNRMLDTALRFLAFMPMAVPGLVLGLGFVFFFNHPANPLNFLYGSMTILVLCSVMHFYTTAHLTAVTALKQIDPEFEAASASLKVPLLRTYLRITVPLCLPAVLEIFRYLFVSSMTTVSAVIFLYSPDTVLASVAVLNMDDAGDVGPAAVMSTLILLTSIAVSLLMHWGLGYWVRRAQAWRTAGKKH